jgi:hypothetical protein
MISAWWLLTLIPAVWFGIWIAGLLHAASDAPDSESVKRHMIEQVRKDGGGV